MPPPSLMLDAPRLEPTRFRRSVSCVLDADASAPSPSAAQAQARSAHTSALPDDKAPAPCARHGSGVAIDRRPALETPALRSALPRFAPDAAAGLPIRWLRPRSTPATAHPAAAVSTRPARH